MRERADFQRSSLECPVPARSCSEFATMLLTRRSQRMASAVKQLLIAASSFESKRDGSIAVGVVQGNERGL